ncbi:MAG TPA: lytic transglycosylase domain-containing protein [Stellaceae bacterium]|nr:lytic transglycosylase domain-containing protein [Stellaceae bacterium]
MAIVAVLGVAATSPTVAQTVSSSVAAVESDPFAVFIDEAARRFGVPALWGRFRKRWRCAGGVAQRRRQSHADHARHLRPAARQSYGLGADPFQPRDNIMAGAAYLREMYDRYGSAGFLAAYNAGPGRYEDHLATGRPLPEGTGLYLAWLASLIAGVRSERIATAPDPLARTRAAVRRPCAGRWKICLRRDQAIAGLAIDQRSSRRCHGLGAAFGRPVRADPCPGSPAMSRVAFLRGLSWCIAYPAVGRRETCQPTRRRPDKSTAVGRGACGGLCRGFCAASRLGKPALAAEIAIDSDIGTPLALYQRRSMWQ